MSDVTGTLDLRRQDAQGDPTDWTLVPDADSPTGLADPVKDHAAGLLLTAVRDASVAITTPEVDT